MICFFRSLTSWEHLAAVDVVSWSVPVFSASKKTGTIQIAGKHPELSGCWAVLDGRLFYAQKAAPGSGSTAVTVVKPIYAFARDLVYSGDGTEDLETFIAGEISANFIQQADAAFAMTYLSVSASGSTAADLAYIDNQVYAFTDVLELAEELGIGFTFAMTASGLSLTVALRSNLDHTVFFNDGHNQLRSASITRDLVSKVTVRRITAEDDTITVASSADYYWHEDGSITTTPPSPRIPGTWAVVSLTDADIELATAAAQAMAGNVESVKIVFASDRDFALGDSITCRVDDRVVTAAVTACTLASGDPRKIYELGSLPTTLTEKFEAAAAKRRERSVTYEQADQTPITTSGGTVGGALNVQATLSASKLSVGTTSYGTALPETGVPGQVFFLISS